MPPRKQQQRANGGAAAASAAVVAATTSVEAPWTLSAQEAARALGVDPALGLDSKNEVGRRRAAVGANELSREDATPLWKLVLAQFDDMLVKVSDELAESDCRNGEGKEQVDEREHQKKKEPSIVEKKESDRRCRRRFASLFSQPQLLSPLHNHHQVLLAAAAVSFLLALVDGSASHEGVAAFVEPGVILLILALNAVVGVWQESNAEAALEALKEMQPESAVVVRDGGKRVSVPAKDLVPGDVVALAAGDRVPADARVLSLATATLRVEQASLTGESVAVHKDVAAVKDARAAILDKSCMLFASTAVVSGSALALVTSTG